MDEYREATIENLDLMSDNQTILVMSSNPEDRSSISLDLTITSNESGKESAKTKTAVNNLNNPTAARKNNNKQGGNARNKLFNERFKQGMSYNQ